LSEDEAEVLGGTLAVIKNAGQQKWVFSTFGSYDGIRRTLYIGLHKGLDNKFAWVTGAPTSYLNWGPNEPDDAGGIENSVEVWPDGDMPGRWNDVPNDHLNYGVVELPGKASEILLSKRERAMIGAWYVGGNKEKPCWVAGTDNALFIISDYRLAARAGLCADGSLFVPEWPMNSDLFGNYNRMPFPRPQTGMRGEIIKDVILWDNGTWWSRKTSEYGGEVSAGNQPLNPKAGGGIGPY
jgi:hypothetical protein